MVRCVLLGESGMSNQALTVTGLCRPHSFRFSLIGLSKRHLSEAARDCTWVWSEGGSVHGLASVRPRSGLKSWELSHLYVDAISESSVTRLLEGVSAAAARSGCERVFLRLSASNPVAQIVRLAGFFPSHGETLYRGATSGDTSRHGLFDADARFRMRRSEDAYGLFRLYNAVTPVKVRQLAGMTFDQWSASHERSPGRLYERVFINDDEVKGWLGVASRFGTANLAVKIHPDYAALTPDVVDSGLRRLTGTVLAIVEEFTPDLDSALRNRGFERQDEFVVLVKTIAQRARDRVPARSSQVVVE